MAAFHGIDRPPVQPYPRDARHHAVSVDSVADWLSWRDRLAAAGATFWEEDHGDQRSLYVVDPSGNVLEITTPETLPSSRAQKRTPRRSASWTVGSSGSPAANREPRASVAPA
ncbi:MAG: VOC family protein [Myxococcales bacterium]|nr:VOC family protein [Myxococcales bacterium]